MPLTSFYTALTGLNNNSLAINVIGDNLANMNTTAFKSSKANFSELLAGLSGTSATGNPTVMGLGSTLNGVTRLNTQGTITSTGISTDAAINGNGFFVVSTEGGLGFTRAGQFELDKDGYFVSSDGFKVLGYPAVNGTANASGALSTIQIKKGQTVPANITTEISLTANLDSQAADGSTFGTAVQVYDSLGTAHTISLTFAKVAAGDWSWSATIPATDTGGAATDPPVTVGESAGDDLTFDPNGILNLPASNPTLSLTRLASGASDMTITFNLSDPSGNPLITSMARDSGVSSTIQNGTAATTLKDISIDSKGNIIGLMENGRSVTIAQLAIADFPNIEGLQKYKGSTFTAFTSSGEPSIGAAGSGGRGTVVGSAIERSNVDMAQEFVNLIAAERAYQANSRIISTTDQLYQESLNLKQ
jgi:flagellar hook protein FlgE